MFKRILVAVDGSPASTAGLHAAVDLAQDQQAAVVAVHVIDDMAFPVNFEGAIYPPSYIDSYFAAQEQQARKLAERACAMARGRRVTMEPEIVHSRGHTVADVIVAQARKLKADVIVIGTHGRRGLRRVVMGSDAEEVVRAATVPVLLVRGGYRGMRKPRAPASATATRKGALGARSRPAAAAPA
jgi:nucleotide-binding universal stress UspA family protein